jgi:hypothetical protein
MKITDEHWAVFGHVGQDKRSFRRTAELMGIPEICVKLLHKDLKKAHPELFPHDTERHVYRYGHEIESFDRLDGDTKIVKKF